MEKMAAKNASEVHELIEREAKEKQVAEVRKIKSIPIGKDVRQGDIYIHRVDDRHERGKKTENRQLAMGNSRGSRHVAEGNVEVFEGVRRPEWCMRGTFLGPLIAAPGPFTITHPEHAHVALPAGVYQITHQMDSRTADRVID